MQEVLPLGLTVVSMLQRQVWEGMGDAFQDLVAQTEIAS